MPLALVLFRRDLRLTDNTALNEAFRTGQAVLPVFIVDAGLMERWREADKRLAFLFQSLQQLEQAIAEAGGRLLLREGDPAAELAELLGEFDVSDVFVNREYTPLGRRRDAALEAACSAASVSFHAPDDAVLNAPGVVTKDNGEPYSVFTPYFKKALGFPVAAPETLEGDFHSAKGSTLADLPAAKAGLEMELVDVAPGFPGAARGLDRLGQLGDYDSQRDIPASGQTSRMSAHLRFGNCSPREFHAAVSSQLGEDHPLNRQLHWRDFYVQIAWHYPHVFGHAFRQVYDDIEWRDDGDEDLALWQAGRTGFPIVDAGMRELLATGTMHNRVRMIVASFLTKNLHIDWRAGEAHFARHLIDYDPAVNNGNWQWGASTGCDAQPYFRVFNPWRQQQKFDKDCVYIKRWVPELEPYPAAAIHKLERAGDFYLPRIVDLKRSSELIKQLFKSVSSGSG